MFILITLGYILFTYCLTYPPCELVAAGFTIGQIFDSILGSENHNFVLFHIRRIALTVFIHSLLPLGYVGCLWLGCGSSTWILRAAIVSMFVPLVAIYKLNDWWHHKKRNHPIPRSLTPFAPVGGDWRQVAVDVNTEFQSIDKISVQLTSTTKFIATATFLIKVGTYSMNVARQRDVTLVADSAYMYNLNTFGVEQIQYIEVSVVPSNAMQDFIPFKFRVSTPNLRELQTRFLRPVTFQSHVVMQSTLIENFVTVFKQLVEENPAFYADGTREQCIGCLQNPADVKIVKRCPPHVGPVHDPHVVCTECKCQVLWCCSCMARWWVARAHKPANEWLEDHGSCPLCRAVFCMTDVCPVRTR